MRGTIELTIDGQANILSAGDGYYFPSTLPHRFRNIGPEEAEIISANTPGQLLAAAPPGKPGWRAGRQPGDGRPHRRFAMTQPTLADWQARAAALTLEGRAFINGQYVNAASGRVRHPQPGHPPGAVPGGRMRRR
ncbi:MAG: cupin domain-containing protein [Rivihabitans pingtungensis]